MDFVGQMIIWWSLVYTMVPEATPHCEIQLATGLGDVKDSISGNLYIPSYHYTQLYVQYMYRLIYIQV